MGAVGSTKLENPPKKRVYPYVVQSCVYCRLVIMGCDGEFGKQIHRRDPVIRRIGDWFGVRHRILRTSSTGKSTRHAAIIHTGAIPCKTRHCTRP